MRMMLMLAALGVGTLGACTKEPPKEIEIRRQAVLMAAELACTAYTQLRAEKRVECPERMEELLEYVVRTDALDPWGNEYQILCGDERPAAAGACIGIRSDGPDRKPNTADDIHSWADR